MNLCSDNHEEVCYEDRFCPACRIRDEKDKEIEKLESAIDDLKSELADANSQE